MKKLLTLLIILLATQSSVFACSTSLSYTVTFTPSGINVHFKNGSTIGYTHYYVRGYVSFGDHSSSLSYTDSTGTFDSSFTHLYSDTGTYDVWLTMQVYDTSSSSRILLCQDSVLTTISLHYTPCYSYITDSVDTTGTYYFTANTPAGPASSYVWLFGDYTYGTGKTTTHTYASPGYYEVKLITSTSTCEDTSYKYVGTPSRVGHIWGRIWKDTTVAPVRADYKVWLITYDSAASIISAIDSTTATGEVATYLFNAKPTGRYLIKAAITNGDTSGTGYVPTYADSSLYWNTASYLYYTAMDTIRRDIYMQKGTLTSGPGFISGSVLTGAGRMTGSTGTVGDPVAGLIIYLRDASNHLVSYTYTDASGAYSLNNIPVGNYSIYPESMNYLTTAYDVSVTSSATSLTGINFKETSTEIKPVTTGVELVAGNTRDIFIYPNPSNGLITIQWDNNLQSGAANITVTNITGQKVYQTQMNINTNNTNVLNLSQLETGLYFINIEAPGINHMQKLLLQH